MLHNDMQQNIFTLNKIILFIYGTGTIPLYFKYFLTLDKGMQTKL